MNKSLKADETKILSAKFENIESTYPENAFGAVDYFKILPDELILHIFKFLPNCKTLLSYCFQVCKRWKRLSIDISLWRNVQLSKEKIHIDKLIKIITFGVCRLELTLCTIRESEDQLFKNDIQSTVKCNNLQYINLYDVEMSENSLINLLSNCSHLIEISIFIFRNINDTVCQCIARNENLITLNLRTCLGYVTAVGMSEIFRKCINIQDINLYAWSFSEEDFTAMFDAIPESSTIKFICLGYRHILDKHIQKLIERCPNLIRLNLAFCKSLTPSSIKFIIDGLPKLQYLGLNCNDFILPESFLKLRCLPSLTNLGILLDFKEPPFPNEIKEKLEQALIHVEVCVYPR